MPDPSFQDLLKRLEHLSDQFKELREGVQKAVLVADLDPEMALTRARKVLELVVREVYERRIQEPPGTRPLENLTQRLVKDSYFPDRLDAYATTVRKLGNVGTHTHTLGACKRCFPPFCVFGQFVGHVGYSAHRGCVWAQY